jgi:hypothetical protein
MLERTKAQSPFYTARRLRAIATGSELTGVAGSGTFRVHRIPSLLLLGNFVFVAPNTRLNPGCAGPSMAPAAKSPIY